MKLKYFAVVFCLLAFVHGQANAQMEGKKLSNKELKKLMQGAWFGAEDDDAAVFSIDGDTAMYIDDFSKFKYMITKDTFELQTTQPHYKELILRISPDSLIFKEVPSGSISKYWRN